MGQWENGTFLNMEDGTLVARVRFQPPRTTQDVVRAVTMAESEQVSGLTSGVDKCEYEVIGGK